MDKKEEEKEKNV